MTMQAHNDAKLRVYVASSWRNLLQPAIVTMIRGMGHQVYDFRNPKGDMWPERHFDDYPDAGFAWKQLGEGWQSWSPEDYREALKHPIAQRSYQADILAVKTADVCVLVLPSGRSASWELGYSLAAGKRTAVVMFEKCEPELMYSESVICATPDDLFDFFGFEMHEGKARKSLRLSGHKAITGGHTFQQTGPCATCGDLDGCHLWREAAP